MTPVAVAPRLRLDRTRRDALTELLLAPPTDDALTLGIVGALAEARSSLAAELPALSAELPADSALVVDWFRLHVATSAPERASEPDSGFSASPAACRRAIGAAAVARCARDPMLAPADAVRAALEAALAPAAAGAPAQRNHWWVEWYRALAPGGRSAVVAEAVLWATQLAGALRWQAFDPPASVGGIDDWWDCPGTRRLSLRGRVDVRVRTGVGSSDLVVGGATAPGAWRALQGLTALAAGLARGPKAVPSRVVGWWPASGEVRVLEVDGGAVADAAAAVLSAAATWVDGRLEVAAHLTR